MMALGSRVAAISFAAAVVMGAAGSVPAKACCDTGAQERLPVVIDAVGALIGAFGSYKERYVRADGRVVDNANGHISHSEGQGYSMLIAAKLGDRATFEAVWDWTRRNLQVREDALLAWKWDPSATPNVVDRNNATDGDLLIVWALVEAGRLWEEPTYLEAAREIALDVAALAVRDTAYGAVFLPGTAGFSESDREDGPVVNLSYWVFPALDPLETIAPEVDWATIFANGRKILRASADGIHALPPEWSSIAGEVPVPAEGFPAVFGYNAIRIPLYLAWSGEVGELLGRFGGMRDEAADVGPFVIDLESGAAVNPLREAGFRSVTTLVECALANGETDDARVALSPTPELYYPDTLNLLSAIAQLERYPTCI